ncbi:PhoU family transcriptional regulator [Corynebacterium phocae]|uniref:Phosphate-specific transport system accessory protein PhoU n=1 Tax=Corynebacterium phocae TaxID=161895 RepID=A0A1L7D1D4_9CORY|nr:phosphate signaling complex protein PhoU [Corynebacterium phocae]APT91966.1 PhoU family transcriptional regulator [Corynebacterium phocae]KAA8726959.1 phosphate signaling complex protein PhoU [Corynebacterium phocae]
MRTAYRERLDNFSHDLIVMCDKVEQMLGLATSGLLDSDLQAAEETLSTRDDLEVIRLRCEERAVRLLALENPLATDLRQVVSSIYIVEDLNRMGKLANHVAKAARRRHPETAIPTEYLGYFRELARLCTDLLHQTRELLINPDADSALALREDDDAIDDINEHIMTILTLRDWPGTAREAVDMALLCRFYERFADHAVNVSSRIVYLTTGLQPDQYLAKKDEASRKEQIELRFADLERQFRR